MPIESGYDNKRKQGALSHKTLSNFGSSRVGEHVASKAVSERNPVAQAITGVDKMTNDVGVVAWRITLAGHGAKYGDVCRFYTGNLSTHELDIVGVFDSNTFMVRDVVGAPAIGDEVKILYYVSPKVDQDGGLVTTSGPTQFIQDGVPTPVTEDTADSANNAPLPAGMFIRKEDVSLPVADHSDPAMVVAVPVKIMAVDGTNINIEAGDISIQTTDMGPNFDSMKIGDGTGEYASFTPDGMKVNSELANGLLEEIRDKDFATETSLGQLVLEQQSLIGEVQNIGLNVSTAAKQDDQINLLDTIDQGIAAVAASTSSIDGKMDTLNGNDFATSAKQDDQITALDTIKTSIDTTNTSIGAPNEAAAGSDTATSGLNGLLKRLLQKLTTQLPASLGQKTMANSLAVTFASDQSALPANVVPAAATVKHATINVGLAAVRATTDGLAPSATRRSLRIFVDPDTVSGGAQFYIGSSAVVAAAGATRGEQIFPGAPFAVTNDANDYYICSSVAAQVVSIVEVE